MNYYYKWWYKIDDFNNPSEVMLNRPLIYIHIYITYSQKWTELI